MPDQDQILQAFQAFEAENAAAPKDPTLEAFAAFEAENAAAAAEPPMNFTAAGPNAKAAADGQEIATATQNLPQQRAAVGLVQDFQVRVRETAQSMLAATRTALGVRRRGTVTEEKGRAVLERMGARPFTPELESIPRLFTSDDVLAHAAGSGIGDVWAVAKDPRAKEEWYREGTRRAAAFMRRMGYDAVAGPTEAAEITSAFLFGELVMRTPMHLRTMGEAARHTLQTLVAERMRASNEQGGGDPQFTNAAAYLRDLTNEEALSLRSYVSHFASRAPRNEQEAQLAAELDGRTWSKGFHDGSLQAVRTNRFPARGLEALRVLTGVSFPEQQVIDLFQAGEKQFRLRDLGLIDGNLFAPGGQEPGFTPVAFLPSDTLTALEQRKKATKRSTALDRQLTPQVVEQVRQQTGLPADQAAEVGQALASRVTAGVAASLDENIPSGGEFLTPTELEGMGASGRLFHRGGELFGRIWENAVADFDALTAAADPGLVRVEAQRIAHSVLPDDNVASQVRGVNDLARVTFGWWRRLAEVGAGGPVVPADNPALDQVDPSIRARIFTDAQSAVDAFHNSKGREELRKEQQARVARMSTYDRTGEGGLGQYALDWFNSATHLAVESVGAGLANFTDDPAHFPVLLGVNVAGGLGSAAGLHAMRVGLRTAFKGHLTGIAMRQLLRFAPEEAATLKRLAQDAMYRAKAPDDMLKAANDLYIAATEFQDEWAAVRKAGQGEASLGSLDRLSAAWRRATDWGLDADGLADTVKSMLPRNVPASLLSGLAAKIGKGRMPRMTDDALRGVAPRLLQKTDEIIGSLGRRPSDIVDAADLERRIATSTDPYAVGVLSQRLAAMQGGHTRNHGMMGRIERAAELEQMAREVAAGRPVDLNRYQRIRTELWGDPALSDMDWATLVQANDLDRWAPGSLPQRFFARLFGNAPDGVVRAANMGSRLLNFSARDAEDFYLSAFNAGLRNVRTSRLYRHAARRIQTAIEDLDHTSPRDATYKARRAALADLGTQIDNEFRRAVTNPAGEAWRLDDDKVVMKAMTDEDLAVIAESDPVLFGGARRDHFFQGDKITPEGKAVLRDLYSTRPHSTVLNNLRRIEMHKSVQVLQKQSKALGQKIKRALERGDPDTAEVLVEERAKVRGRLKNIHLRNRSKVRRALRNLGDFEADTDAAGALRWARAETDVLAGPNMPFWALAKQVHALPRFVAWRQALQLEKLNGLHSRVDELRRTLPRELWGPLDESLRTGRLDEALMKKGPLRAAWDRVYPKGDATRARNLQEYLSEAEEFRAAMLADMEETGRVNPQLRAKLERDGYNPHQYTVYELRKHVNDRRVQEAAHALGGGGGGAGGAPGVRGNELKYQRDLTRHRVRVAERDGFVREERFDSIEEAQAWIGRQYGSEAVKTVTRTKSGFLEGRTASGDSIVLSEPIGAEGLEVLGIVGRTPEAQLLSFQDAVVDTHMHALLSAMRSTGMVLSPAEHTSTILAAAAKYPDIVREWVVLPKDRERLGNMSGYYVHKKLFSELANYKYSFDQFRTWIDAISGMYMASGDTIPQELVNRLPGTAERIYRPIIKVAKNSLIAWNPQTWSGNILFDVVLAHLADARLFHPSNLGSLRLAAKEVFAPGVRRSAEWMEFVEDGFGSNGVFEKSHFEPAVRNVLRALRLDNPRDVERSMRQRELLLRDFERAQIEGESPKHVDRIKVELAGLRTVHDFYERSIGRRVLQSVTGFLTANPNVLNLPGNRLTNFVKKAYNGIDDFFKFASYLNLRKRMGRNEARIIIREGFQDYSGVPNQLASLSVNPLGSMVPSFPWELARLGKNQLTRQPLRFISFLSLVPALNQFGAAAAGVSEDRVNALMHQAGHRNSWERFKAMASELRIYNPVTHDLALTVQLQNAIPFLAIGEGRGFLAQAAEEWIPEETRGLGSGLLAQGVEFLGQFFMNNVVANGIGAVALNRDPLTGQQILDRQNARPMDYLRAGWRHLARNFVPSVGVTVVDEIPRALMSPVDPGTGRTVGSPGIVELLSSKMALRVKGVEALWRKKAKAEGRPLLESEAMIKSVMYAFKERDPSWLGDPQFGPDADIRWYLAASQDPSATPEKRAEYDRALRELMKESRTVTVLGKEQKLTSTERAEWLKMENLERRGIPASWKRMGPEEQAGALVWLDRAGLKDGEIEELVKLSLFDDRGVRLQLERDPEALMKAITAVRGWREDPRSSPALDRLITLWGRQQARAAGLYKRERKRAEIRKGLIR